MHSLKQPKVSIVVPIYNVEKYLHQCVDSIANQTLKDIEIILVNDGSPDSCGEICDEYAKKDARVKVIHKANGGVGAAYNTGIEIATGETIALVESDDWIESNMYEKLYKIFKTYNPDIIKCDFYRYNSYRKPSSIPYNHGVTALQNIYPENTLFTIADAPLLLAYHSSVWAGLFKANFLKSHAFLSTQGAGYVDFPFMFEAYLDAKGIVLTYNKFNHYRFEEGQESSTKKPGAGALRIIDQILYVKDLLKQKQLLAQYQEEFYFHASKCCYGFFYYSVSDDYEEAFYQHMLNVYADFPKNFEFRYFGKDLQQFVERVLEGDKKKIFKVKEISRIKKVIKNIFSIQKKMDKNGDTFKVIVILGIKINLKRNKSNA